MLEDLKTLSNYRIPNIIFLCFCAIPEICKQQKQLLAEIKNNFVLNWSCPSSNQSLLIPLSVIK